MIINIIQETCIHISPKKVFMLKTFNIEIWFTDQNSKPLEIEDNININLVTNQRVTYKSDLLFN